jgi:hypothetical protein
MKRLLNTTLILPLLVALCLAVPTNRAKAQDVTVSYQSFYDNLAPYGQWIYDPQFGNVFVPNEDAGFRPYTRGHWVMTEYGNTWVSDDPWGWACYHYGRWTYNGYYGWIWIPGYEWAPAWVSWRWGGGYCGWAPLGPGLYAGDNYYCPENWWVFIQPAYIYEPRWHDHWDGYASNRVYIRRTDFMNNYDAGGSYGHYNYGPRAEVVERTTNTRVVVYRTTNSNSAGPSTVNQNTVSIYHPRVDRNSVSTARPAQVMQAPHPITAKGEPEAKPGANTVPAFRQEHPMPVQNQRQPGAPGQQPGQRNLPPQTPATQFQQGNRQPEPAQHAPQPAPGNQFQQGNRQPEPVQHAPQPAPGNQFQQGNRQPEPVQHNPQPVQQQQPPRQQPQPVQQQQAPHPVQQQQPARQQPQPVQQQQQRQGFGGQQGQNHAAPKTNNAKQTPKGGV